ncbi:MAG: hypothetical protein HON65_13630 [Rhodospirillales bacterium]|nr:hypothetical protein [Rhodospirillales bacterium]
MHHAIAAHTLPISQKMRLDTMIGYFMLETIGYVLWGIIESVITFKAPFHIVILFVCLIFLGSAFYHAGEEKWMLAWTFGGIGSVGIFSMFSWYIYKKHSGSGGGHD